MHSFLRLQSTLSPIAAALVVAALQDVAPLPPGDIAEPVELEAVTRSSRLPALIVL